MTGFAFATTRSYDALNRLKDSTDARSGVTRFDCNGREDLTQLTDPRNLPTQYPRNGLGDATGLLSPDTGTAGHTYDAAGNLTTRTDSRGVLATYGYDVLNRLTQVVYGTERIARTVAAIGVRMSLSIPGMVDYVDALIDNRFEDAKRHLLVAISSVKALGAEPVLAGLAQRLGEILLKQGDKLSALGLYELSECLDPGSLLARLDYAKFLMYEVGEKVAAAAKCRVIITAATAEPVPESDNDFSSEEYVAAARILREAMA